MEIATGRRQRPQPMRKVDQTPGNQMAYPVSDLQLTEDPEQPAGQQFAALPGNQLGADHDIDQAAFVFEGDKHNAGGGAWPLAADHDAGGTEQGAVAVARQLGGRDETTGGELWPQQVERMRPQTEAETAVIGDQLFTLTGRRQDSLPPALPRQGSGAGRRGKEIALHRRRRSDELGSNGPGRLPAMAAEAAQGIGGSQQVEIAP